MCAQESSKIIDTVLYESAVETSCAYEGFILSQIFDERSKEKPNQDKIATLEEERTSVFLERRQFSLDDPSTFKKALYVYAPIIKAIHGKLVKNHCDVPVAEQSYVEKEKREAHVREVIGLCHMADSKLPDFMPDLFNKYITGEKTIAQLIEESETLFQEKYLRSDA